MDSPDLLSLGQHCSVPECRQRDFLPFKCDCCGKVYCLEHRTYSGHQCQKADAQTPTTIICPLCARALKISPMANPNLVFEEHTKQDCDPSNYSKVMRKKKCPVPGCKEKLTSINTYTCKHCAETICLKHRFPEDHSCAHKPRQGSNQQPGTLASLRKLFSFNNLGEPMARGQQPAAHRDADRQKGRQGASLQPPQRSTRRPEGGSGSGAEICPVCNASFRNLNDLIAHSTATHQGGYSPTEVCPHCQALFVDAVQLVEHVERHHSRGTACVLS